MENTITYQNYRGWQKPIGNHIAPFFGAKEVIDLSGGPSM